MAQTNLLACITDPNSGLIQRISISQAGFNTAAAEVPITLLFETDSDILQPRGVPIVDAVADCIGQSIPPAMALVIGHTDSTGSEAHNLALSEHRAASVVERIVADGIPPSRVSATGMGARQPLASNDTESGREQNRRVEILLSTDYRNIASLVNSRTAFTPETGAPPQFQSPLSTNNADAITPRLGTGGEIAPRHLAPVAANPATPFLPPAARPVAPPVVARAPEPEAPVVPATPAPVTPAPFSGFRSD